MSRIAKLNRRHVLVWTLGFMVLFLMLYGPLVFASTSPKTFGSFAKSVNSAIPKMSTLVASLAYLGGIAFAVMEILKFKQHKDSPQQVTLGLPIVMILVAAALLFLPTMIKTTGVTLTGSVQSQGTPETGAASGKRIWDKPN